MSLPTILIVGSLNTDLVTTTSRVPNAGETIQATSFATYFGGKGANQAVACARLSRLKTTRGIITAPSTYVRMVGCVGDDDFGSSLKNGLKSDGIDINGIEVKEGVATGVAVILVESSGENRILITAGANGLCKPSVSYLSPAPALLVLQLEIPLDTVLEMLDLASEASIPILLNPAPARQIPHEAYGRISHLILNETEAAILGNVEAMRTESETETLEDCQRLSHNFVGKGVTSSIVITLGGKGAFWHDVRSGENSIVPGEKVEVVDTTAAGDTFVGGLSHPVIEFIKLHTQSRIKSDAELETIIAFAVKIVNGNTVADSVAYAIRASAKTVTKQGAQSAIPWRDEVS
ncbi:Fructokinase-1 [Dactylellina cionopaga]|nr:Fructokinase-1 [Dactylellina cionopaga]